MMLRYILEDAVQQAHLKRTMIWNTDVMLAALLGCNLNVRTALAPRLISQPTQGANQFRSVAVPWEPQAARTSSLT